MGWFHRLSAVAVIAAAVVAASRSGATTIPGAQQTEGLAPCRAAGPPIALGQLPEASGLAASRDHAGILWSHNDSGDPIVFAIGTDGSIKGRVQIAGARVEDWEDIAVGACPAGSCLYIADIGDNHSSRSSITVYRVPEPAPRDGTSRPAEAFHATYPDGPRDAEGLFVTAGGLFIITKDEPVGVYRFPPALRRDAKVRLQRVAAPGGPGGRVTAADASPDGRWVAARTHRALIFYRAGDLLAGKPREVLRFDLAGLREPQGEGVALLSNGTVFLSGEGNRGGTLARISCELPR